MYIIIALIAFKIAFNTSTTLNHYVSFTFIYLCFIIIFLLFSDFTTQRQQISFTADSLHISIISPPENYSITVARSFNEIIYLSQDLRSLIDFLHLIQLQRTIFSKLLHVTCLSS